MLSAEEALTGKGLYGDDFNIQQIAEWHAAEKEACAEIAARNPNYQYGYHALNQWHAYRHLPAGRFSQVMGLGSALGDEFLPIASRIDHLTIVEASDAYARNGSLRATYVKPTLTGNLPCADDRFDLITCFGVLHHIPNVSAVVRELARVLKPGGYLALSEPIITMGDWRVPRRGLTQRERGIPLPILRRIVQEAGLTIAREAPCIFSVTHRLFNGPRSTGFHGIYNRTFPTIVDAMLSRLFAWNVNYHPRTFLRKLCPTSVFLLLTK